MNREVLLSGNDWQILGLVPGGWQSLRVGLAGTDLDQLQPPVPGWLAAQVPGHVQADLLDAGEIPDWRYDRDSRSCEWTSHRDWVYRKRFRLDPDLRGAPGGSEVRLRFDGVDDACHVFLNGVALGRHIGMAEPFEHQVTSQIRWDGDNELVVVVEQAPPEPILWGQMGWSSQVRHWKARFSYGWDWCTRLVPLGIWDHVRLLLIDRFRLVDVHVQPWLDPDAEGGPAEVRVTARVAVLAALTGRLVATIVDPAGAVVAVAERVVSLWPGEVEVDLGASVVDPCLWWPNGAGAQPLYHLDLVLEDGEGVVVDASCVSFGFRHLRWVPASQAPADARPYALEVNRRPVFLKGWNWVPVDQLYGRPHEAAYRHLLRLVTRAGCNLLRVWGGGILERELFYDLCDQAGIMVWQELGQSSSGIDNVPPADEEYLSYALAQTEAMVRRIRSHASLVLWCGGNELVGPDEVPLGEDHPTLAALGEMVGRLDAGRRWLPTSPSGPVFAASLDRLGQMHDVHGPWIYLGPQDHYRFHDGIDPLLYSEVGVEGAANLSSLRRTLPPERLWPPDRTNPSWVHHGNWWLNREMVERLFGPLGDIEPFVAASQWLQAEGLRYVTGACRRRPGRTAGILPWQLNEAWPNASCTNAVDYWGHPKPAYWAVAAAYGDPSLSVRHEGLQWQPGEEFRAEVWVCTDAGLQGSGGGVLRWCLVDVETGQPWTTDEVEVPILAPGSAQAVVVVHHELPSQPTVFALVVSLDLVVESGSARRGSEDEYLFSSHAGAFFAPVLGLVRTGLAVEQVGSEALVVSTSSTAPLVGLRLDALGDHDGPYVSRGWRFFVPPGGVHRVGVAGSGRLSVSAWNADSVLLDL